MLCRPRFQLQGIPVELPGIQCVGLMVQNYR